MQGLQTVNADALEAAMIDGASRLQRVSVCCHSTPKAIVYIRRFDPTNG
jgi:ABC-type polysaccharide transport system permease subunit